MLRPADDVVAPDAREVAEDSSGSPEVRSPRRRTVETEQDASQSGIPSPTAPPSAASEDEAEHAAAAEAKAKDSHVTRGLRWFRDRQDAEGGWGDPGSTGIVLLTFTGAGETHQSGSYRELVKKGLQRLRNGQGEDGRLVPPHPQRLGDHAIAALALSQAYGMTSSRVFKDPAQRAVEFALASRAPGGAWNLPAPLDAHVDVETTAWMSMLLKSAKLSELDVDSTALAEVATSLDRITDPSTGRIVAPSPSALSDDAATAVGALVRLWAGRNPESDPLTAASIDALLARPPAADTADLAYVHFGSCAMLTLGGEKFRLWLPHLNAVALRPFRAEEPERGSWDPPSGAAEDARVWTTAYHLLMLEFYYGRVGKAGWPKNR